MTYLHSEDNGEIDHCIFDGEKGSCGFCTVCFKHVFIWDFEPET
jgi:hypothetical protein